MNNPPKIDNAPGLKWRKRRTGWSARWSARDDLAERGYKPKSQNLYFWKGEEIKSVNIGLIQSQCNQLQTDMLVWGRGGIPKASPYDETVQGLIDSYMSDDLSTYREVRYHTRQHYQTLCRVMARTMWTDDDEVTRSIGETKIADIRAKTIKRWHRTWSAGGTKLPMGHALVGMLRTLMGFGVTILEDDQCTRVATVLGQLRFPMGRSRDAALTSEQIVAIRQKAHEKGYHSIALAQAIQFEFTWRQKDVIGEWVPQSEQPPSYITNGNDKWLRGLVWKEIDPNMIVHHVTSKRQKLSEPDIKLAPMVIEELQLIYGSLDRALMPGGGPVIICEDTGLPWAAQSFRNIWRELANECGIPKNVKNMDTRAGAITEAFAADASPDKVRKAATHSTISMTNRYSRDDQQAVAEVMQIRSASRANKG